MIMNRDDFRQRLEQELHAHLTLSHPIFEQLLNPRAPNRQLLRQMTLQGYQLTKHFLTYIEHLFFYCPVPRHKLRLLHNMYEEQTGRLSRTKNHVELMRDFIRALDICDEDRDEQQPLPNTTELIKFRMDACKDTSRYHIAAAAVLIASEGQNLETLGAEPRDVLFRRIYGLSEKDLLFFSVHQKEDVGHVRQGLDLVADICDSETKQREALHSVAHTCQLFYQMYEGMQQHYVRSAEPQHGAH